MQIPRLLTLLIALVVVGIVILAGMQFVQPPRALVEEAAFDRATITPNADGDNDLSTLTYTLTRNAQVTVTLIDAEGQEYYFRDSEARVPDTYRVNFGGIVHGYTLPGETVQGEIEARLLANGSYTWRLTAVADDGEVGQASGSLTIADADNKLPDLVEFDVSPEVFTPNQDGIADRVTVNAYVTKDATLTMYLEGGDVRAYITEVTEDVPLGTAGRHLFDYDGGIDNGREPPPDGDYTLVLLAEDAEGQRVRRTDQLGVRDGGYPLGSIYPQLTGTTVYYDTMPYDERYFTDGAHMGDLIPVPEGVEFDHLGHRSRAPGRPDDLSADGYQRWAGGPADVRAGAGHGLPAGSARQRHRLVRPVRRVADRAGVRYGRQQLSVALGHRPE